MKRPKLKWRVSQKPAGLYASFQHRGWPSAQLNGKTAAHLSCEDDYVPANVKTGKHRPIRVRVAQYNIPTENRHKHGAFRWRLLKKEAATLAEAKAIAQKFWDEHPNF